MKKTRALVIAAVAILSAAAQPALATDPSKSGVSVAFARVSTNDGTLKAFGGKGTTSAMGTTGEAGGALVTFTGKYPKTIDANKVVVQATCLSGNYEAANAVVNSASSTQIDVLVYCWKSDTLLYTGDDAFVSVYIGR